MDRKEQRLARLYMSQNPGTTYQEALLRVREEFARDQKQVQPVIFSGRVLRGPKPVDVPETTPQNRSKCLGILSLSAEIAPRSIAWLQDAPVVPFRPTRIVIHGTERSVESGGTRELSVMSIRSGIDDQLLPDGGRGVGYPDSVKTYHGNKVSAARFSDESPQYCAFDHLYPAISMTLVVENPTDTPARCFITVEGEWLEDPRKPGVEGGPGDRMQYTPNPLEWQDNAADEEVYDISSPSMGLEVFGDLSLTKRGNLKARVMCQTIPVNMAPGQTLLQEVAPRMPMQAQRLYVPRADRGIVDGGTGDLLLQFCWVGRDPQILINSPGRQSGVPVSYFREQALRTVWMDTAYPAIPFSVQLVNPTLHTAKDVQVCFVGRRIS